MSQSLATYSHGYTTRSCRQQCIYATSLDATENVLTAAAVSGDGHEVAQDFTLNYEDNSGLHNYKILQQQIIGHTIQSVEDFEEWLRHTSEHISNPEINVKSNVQASLERSSNEQLSEASDKELLTDIELAAKKLNIDYNAISAELQNNTVLPANVKIDEFILPEIQLNYYTKSIPTQEISATNSHVEYPFFADEFDNSKDKLQSDNVGETVEVAEMQNEVENVPKYQELQNTETDLTNNVEVDPLFDATLTMSIQDLSIENDSSDGSSDPTNCTNIEPNANKSENLNSSVVVRKKYNTRSKSTNSSNVKSKFEPSIIKRKRKVNNQENTVETDKNNTNTVIREKIFNGNVKKSSTSSTCDSSETESDDVCKGRNPLFISAQEQVISKALEEVGITESTLEYYYNSKNLKTWRCHLKDCYRSFAKLSYLKAHLMAHMNIKPFKCNYSSCSWAFYSEFKLKRHKETHFNKKDFVCPVAGCQRRFTTCYILANHEKLHARPSKIVCQVSNCAAKFQTKRALESHMKCHDESLAPYACDYEACGKRFYSSNALTTHQRCHNYNADELKCAWPGCGKTFDHPCRKKEHMRSHTGQRPYACTFDGCGWAFSTASKLGRHQKKHSNERKFICSEVGCAKAFLRSEHLREHKQTHNKTTANFFRCHYCSARFHCKSILCVHIQNHLRMNDVPQARTEDAPEMNVEGKLRRGRKKRASVESSASETENIAMNMVANVAFQKMYKCPVECCPKWYSHRSSLRVHLRKHASPLAEIQNVDLEENAGAARTEFTREFVLKLKPDRQVVGSSEVGTSELSEGLLHNRALPSVYSEGDDDLQVYQILPLDAAAAVDGMQVLD